MNVGPLPLAQPGSRGAFAFDSRAAYPYQQPAQYHALTASQSPAFSAQTRTSQAYLPGPQSGYDGGHAAMALTGGAAQAVPAQAPTGPQPQLARHTASASPQPRPSPHAVSSSQQTPPNNNNKYPMAAPPLPRSPANQQAAAASQQGSASPSAHPTPQSPGSHSREQQRVALLLDINTDMLHEVNRLQAEGKGGATTPQIQAQMKAAGQPADLASEEYTQVLRRVQANLGYLMPVAQNDAQKTPRGPAYMSPPAHMPQLQPKFDQLRELFPDWQGFEPRVSQSSMSPGAAHGGGGVNGTTPMQA
ncbi:hypothetical protein LTS09_002204 [Friedmanniomyces endolithicus]|nr:hypothetical protein LTS09_002204 [Friedmanniomyces endolithicus]